MKNKIYLDNNATTELDPLVIEAVLQELSCGPSNPSSAHSLGLAAKGRLQGYRERIACFLNLKTTVGSGKVMQDFESELVSTEGHIPQVVKGPSVGNDSGSKDGVNLPLPTAVFRLKVKPNEILFTSGGTESMNFLLKGARAEGHIISTNIEHSCVYHTLLELQKQGADVSFLPAGLLGAVSPELIEAAIRPDTRFITLCAVNGETGVKHDIAEIGRIALKHQIPVFVDGVAWLGKELFSIPAGITGIGFSGHKIHAPKGTGFVYLNSSCKLNPLLIGAHQEYGLRAGTENLPGIAGLAKAIELITASLPAATERMACLRDRLEAGLLQKAAPAVVNGMGKRICNVSNIAFPQDLGEDLLIALDRAGIAISHGSACASGALEPSRILTQMGLPFSVARSALRFSLSRYTTEEEIDKAISVTAELVSRLRN